MLFVRRVKQEFGKWIWIVTRRKRVQSKCTSTLLVSLLLAFSFTISICLAAIILFNFRKRSFPLLYPNNYDKVNTKIRLPNLKVQVDSTFIWTLRMLQRYRFYLNRSYLFVISAVPFPSFVAKMPFYCVIRRLMLACYFQKKLTFSLLLLYWTPRKEVVTSMKF